jgi:hypothetical protein
MCYTYFTITLLFLSSRVFWRAKHFCRQDLEKGIQWMSKWQVWFPFGKYYLDAAQIENGNPDCTDFLSWLLRNVGKENYGIEYQGEPYSPDSGWLITFRQPQHAMWFKLFWL